MLLDLLAAAFDTIDRNTFLDYLKSWLRGNVLEWLVSYQKEEMFDNIHKLCIERKCSQGEEELISYQGSNFVANHRLAQDRTYPLEIFKDFLHIQITSH